MTKSTSPTKVNEEQCERRYGVYIWSAEMAATRRRKENENENENWNEKRKRKGTGVMLDPNRDTIIRVAYTLIFLSFVLLDYRRVRRESDGLSEEAREFRFNIVTGLFLSLGGFVLNPVSIFLYHFVYKYRIVDFPTGALGFLLALLLLDFLYYWNHRFNHFVPFMWKAHRIHHEGRHMNLSLGPRQSVWQSLYAVPFFLPMALIGITYEAVLLGSLVAMAYQFATHCRWQGEIRALRGWLVFPKDHIVHHGSESQFHDKNYAGIFIFWDRMFRTYETDGRPQTLGFPEEPRPLLNEWVSAFRPLPFFSLRGLRMGAKRRSA